MKQTGKNKWAAYALTVDGEHQEHMFGYVPERGRRRRYLGAAKKIEKRYPDIALEMRQMADSVSWILNRLCPGLSEQRETLSFLLDDRHFNIYPGMLGVRADKAGLAQASRMTRQFYEYMEAYNNPPLEHNIRRLFAEGIEFVTDASHETILGISGFSELPGVRYRVGIANRALDTKKERDKTLLHECLHLNLDLNGSPLGLISDESVLSFIDEKVAKYDTERLMEERPKLLTPVGELLMPNNTLVLKELPE